MFKKGMPNNPTLTLVSTWKAKCGIATYTNFLASQLRLKIKTKILPIKSPPPNNPFYFASLAISAARYSDIIHVQFEPGIFGQFKFAGFNVFPLCYVFFAFLFLVGHRKRVVITQHTPPVNEGITNSRFGSLFLRVVYFLSDVIVVHTNHAKKLMLKIAKNVKMIPHGAFENPTIMDKETSKKALGVFGKKTVTIFGFVYSHKGHDILLDLAPELPNNVMIVVAGGPQNDEGVRYLNLLKRNVQESGSQDKVLFLNYIPENQLPTVLSATDVAVLPYKASTQSGILHIILSYLIPTVSSDLPNFVELRDEFGCISTFRKGDRKDLLCQIVRLLENEEERERLIKNCTKFWQCRRWSRISEMHEILYSEIDNCQTRNQI